MKKTLYCTLWLALCCSPCFALTVPERLVYDISWSGVSAGKTVQEVRGEGDELRITSTTRSASWLSLIFPVDDKVESILSKAASGAKVGFPRYYRERVSEGRTHTDKEVIFDTNRLSARTKDHLQKSEKEDPISGRTYDTLSCIYFVRGMELTPGRSLYIDIFDCKRLWNTEVQVLRREEITTQLGTFKTVVVKPLLKSPGFFARTGDIHIWVTDDLLRLPVKMTTKVKIGSITATLVGGSYWDHAAQ